MRVTSTPTKATKVRARQRGMENCHSECLAVCPGLSSIVPRLKNLGLPVAKIRVTSIGPADAGSNPAGEKSAVAQLAEQRDVL